MERKYETSLDDLFIGRREKEKTPYDTFVENQGYQGNIKQKDKTKRRKYLPKK